METLVLASHSPRRMELLTLAGIPFETASPDVDESCSLLPSEAVAVLSARKALAVSAHYPSRFVLAADTLVAVDGVPLGKPADEDDACRMLRLLSGRTHQVYTGVSVLSPSGSVLSGTDCTDVTFCTLTEEEIVAYVQSGEPMDKAGAYALQGRAALWIEKLNGSHTCVIGLPMVLVRKMLLDCGYPLPATGLKS
ncbi:MAG: septum formation protein Maf [Clostridia bacterium]|nr:septum formation protein Maf [Clostridia bacterium]